MGYLKIKNSYVLPEIFDEKEVYALEKLHGTSAHVAILSQTETTPEAIRFFAGGASGEGFEALFSRDELRSAFVEIRAEWGDELEGLVVHGEAYGGKQQGMRLVYGEALRFCAFDVKLLVRGCEPRWADVPQAQGIANRLGLDFVDYVRIPATREAADRERDRPSVQAVRNGVGDGKWREGVVLRPIVEKTYGGHGERLIAKHKRPEACETTSRWEVKPELAKRLTDAAAVAAEWVTPNRLRHVLDKLRAQGFPEGWEPGIEKMSEVIRIMRNDVAEEAGELVAWFRETDSAVARATAGLFKDYLGGRLRDLVAEVVEGQGGAP